MEKQSELSAYELCLLQTKANRAMRELINEQLKLNKLTVMDWLLLCTIDSSGKSGMQMSRIATTFDVTLPQITTQSTKLISAKLIHQKTSSQDSRVRILSLTLRGKRTLPKLQRLIDSSFKAWSKSVTRDQMRMHANVLEKLSK